MKSISHHHTALLSGTFLTALTAFHALAQENEHRFELDPLEVSTEQEPGDIQMGADQIERIQASDLSELFSNQSTLAVGGGSPVAQKIYVRGFEDTMLNVTVDGAQQIGELYHHQGRLQLEPEFIKMIELDAGAGAATSGAGALTGVMRVTLKDAFDLLGDGQRVGFFVKGTGAFNGDNNYKAVGSTYAKVTDAIGAIATVSYADGGDYKDGNGDLATPTAYTQERGYVKFNGVHGAQSWNLSYENLHDFGTYYERPHMTGFRDTFVLSDHQMNRETLTFNHRFEGDSELLNLESTLYWTDSDYQNHRNTTGALYGRGQLESLGFDLRDTARFEQNTVVVGIDFRRDRSDSAQQATPPPYWGSSEQEARVMGLYAQSEWTPNERLTISAGLRFDAYDHKVLNGVGAGGSNDESGFSPNISATWNIVENLSLRAAYAQAFRGITIREAFFSAIYVHDGTLEAETADNIEFGFAWESDGFFVRGTYYEQSIENYINAEWVGADVWGYWRNMGDAKVDGYEFEVGKYWKNLFFSLGVWDAENTFNDEALTDADLGLGTSIGRTWNARFQYALPDLNLDLGVFAKIVEEEENTIAAGAPPKDSYFTTDVFAHWSPRGDDTLIVTAAIRNLFDEFYYDHGTYAYNAGAGTYIGFAAKGIEPSISVKMKF